MLIGKQFGRYEIRSKIGAGGMGEVYTAHDAELDRRVAVKILPAEFSGDESRKLRFRQEARAVSALNHPNIITIYEIGENEHGSFLVTELIDGTTLREVIKHEPLSLVRTLKIVEQAATALVAAHQAHIVHRDIKPENIMVRRDGIVKVLDFGLAKPTLQNAEDDNELAKTIPGMVMGSVRYMSPEQTRGLAVDERTDVWSLGVVLYEMLTGNAPFNGATTSDTIAAVIYKEPEPLSNLAPNAPAELQRIARKALQKDRDERYQSIKDFAIDIKNLIYDLEHESSGERIRTISKDLDISENPTMIHQTISTNHPTRVFESSNESAGFKNAGEKSKKPLWKYAFGALAGIVLLGALLAFGFYKWIGAKPKLAADAFEKTQISRVNTEGKVLMPAISPDGKYIAYTSGDSGNRSLVVRQVSTDSVVTVVPPTNLNFSALTFSPSGDYIYYNLTRSDFSVNTLYQVPTLGGTPKKLIEDVDSAVTFSPDAKKFAFIRYTSKTNESLIFIVDAESLNAEKLISSNQTDFDFFTSSIAWSPDGKKILLSGGKRTPGTSEETTIAEVSISEKNVKPINERKWYAASNFCWFKDGSGFLFAGRESQNAPLQVWRASYPEVEFHQVTNDFNDYNWLGLAADGKTIITLKGDTVSSLWNYSTATKENSQLTSDSRSLNGYYGLAQIPDGKLIYTQREAKETDFWTADADGKNPRLLAANLGYVYAPVPTADGRYIVFSAQSPRSTRIWRIDADGKNPVQLTEENPQFADYDPQVMPDGKTVIFQQRAINDNNRSSLMKVSIDGGKASPFYSSEQWNIYQPRISPDGKHIVFNTYDVNTFERRIRLAALNGDSLGQIKKDFEFNLINAIFWSPDSKSLTILSTRSGTANLWRLPIEGSSAQQPITDFDSGRILNFAWSNDGRNIFLVRGIANNDLILIRDSSAEKI